MLRQRFTEAFVHGGALHIENLFELALNVLEGGAEVVLVQRGAPLLSELLEEVPQAVHALAQWVAHASLKEVPQRVLQVPKVH